MDIDIMGFFHSHDDDYALAYINKKEQIDNLEGLVILIGAAESTIQVIDWLILCNEHPGTFVWVFSKVPLDNRKEVLLKMGADSVVETKNNLKLLSLQIKNTIKKVTYLTSTYKEKKVPQFLNIDNRSVYIDGEEKDLTEMEFKLLDFLYRTPNKTVFYQDILNELWTNIDQNSKYLLTNLKYSLGNKIKKSTLFSIKTIRSKGYMLYINKKNI